MQRQRQFDSAQVAGQMPAILGHHLDDAAADFSGELLKFGGAEVFDVLGGLDAIQDSGLAHPKASLFSFA